MYTGPLALAALFVAAFTSPLYVPAAIESGPIDFHASIPERGGADVPFKLRLQLAKTMQDVLEEKSGKSVRLLSATVFLEQRDQMATLCGTAVINDRVLPFVIQTDALHTVYAGINPTWTNVEKAGCLRVIATTNFKFSDRGTLI